MTTRKMYISGGIGSRYVGEAFGEDYELPNGLAYTETCAAIGSIMWNWRMLLIEDDARYADLIEWQLYNAMLAGVSLDGETYFYQNPLADEGEHRRAPWFETACCPPNVARTVASLPGYFYGVTDDAISVHHYAEGSAQIALADGRTVRLRQTTRYPWDGDIAIELRDGGEFGLRLRIPGWCDHGASLSVNGTSTEIPLASGRYAEIQRTWQVGDVVRLSLPMPARRIMSHPWVVENTNRVALTRGPLLYCVEQADNPGVDLRDLALPVDGELHAEFRPELLGGVVTLSGRAMTISPASDWNNRLYRTARMDTEDRSGHEVAFTAIPYFAWANREPGRMRVWLADGV
jgi:DUF1680 family protein